MATGIDKDFMSLESMVASSGPLGAATRGGRWQRGVGCLLVSSPRRPRGRPSTRDLALRGDPRLSL